MAHTVIQLYRANVNRSIPIQYILSVYMERSIKRAYVIFDFRKSLKLVNIAQLICNMKLYNI